MILVQCGDSKKRERKNRTDFTTNQGCESRKNGAVTVGNKLRKNLGEEGGR